jgi:hypothetical protein
MTNASAAANLETKSVSLGGTTYDIRPLAADTFTVLVAGVPVGRIVYTFGAANGVPEGDADRGCRGLVRGGRRLVASTSRAELTVECSGRR